MKEELNVYEIKHETDEEKFVFYSAEGDNTLLGRRLQKNYSKDLKNEIAKLSNEQIRKYIKDGKITIKGVEIFEGELLAKK